MDRVWARGAPVSQLTPAAELQSCRTNPLLWYLAQILILLRWQQALAVVAFKLLWEASLQLSEMPASLVQVDYFRVDRHS
jgi:hypothetical protein